MPVYDNKTGRVLTVQETDRLLDGIVKEELAIRAKAGTETKPDSDVSEFVKKVTAENRY